MLELGEMVRYGLALEGFADRDGAKVNAGGVSRIGFGAEHRHGKGGDEEAFEYGFHSFDGCLICLDFSRASGVVHSCPS